MAVADKNTEKRKRKNRAFIILQLCARYLLCRNVAYLSLIYTQVWECTLYWPHSLTYHCIQTHTHTPNKINDLMPTWFLKSIPGYKMNLQGLLSTSTIATGCEHRYYLWCEQLKFHHSHSKQWSMDSIIELGPSAAWVARLVWSWLLGGLIPLGHNGTHTHTHTAYHHSQWINMHTKIHNIWNHNLEWNHCNVCVSMHSFNISNYKVMPTDRIVTWAIKLQRKYSLQFVT